MAGFADQVGDRARGERGLDPGPRLVAERFLAPLDGGARLFAYPSSYEGFGLPPMEATACGVPTLVADRSCLPEVTGGAAMLVDPDDHDALARSLERGLTDEAWRSRDHGRAGARAAVQLATDGRETIAAYRKVAA